MSAVAQARPDAGRQIPASPPAVRLRRPGWRDPRLLLGLVLVALSVLLGTWAVRDAGSTTPVLVAARALPPGTALADAVEIRQVRLPDVDGLYLTPDDDLSDLVVVRTVGAGELVPRDAVGSRADLGLRPVAIVPRGPLPAAVVAGSTVDLWFVPEVGSDDEAEPPRPLVSGVPVAEVAEERRGLSVGGGRTVHVLVPVAELPAVLAALAGEGSVEVVHVPGGVAAP